MDKNPFLNYFFNITWYNIFLFLTFTKLAKFEFVFLKSFPSNLSSELSALVGCFCFFARQINIDRVAHIHGTGEKNNFSSNKRVMLH